MPKCNQLFQKIIQGLWWGQIFIQNLIILIKRMPVMSAMNKAWMMTCDPSSAPSWRVHENILNPCGIPEGKHDKAKLLSSSWCPRPVLLYLLLWTTRTYSRVGPIHILHPDPLKSERIKRSMFGENTLPHQNRLLVKWREQWWRPFSMCLSVPPSYPPPEWTIRLACIQPV